MSLIERVYTKTANPDKVSIEIEAALPGLLEAVVYEDPTLSLWLKREPTGVEDALLTSTVNNHSPAYKEYKIWDFVNYAQGKHEDPSDINFSILPLAVKKTYIRGELDIIEYFGSATVDATGSVSYSDPVLKTTWVYTRDPLGYPVYAEEKAQWYYHDDTLGIHTKLIPHYYDGVDKIQEGMKRRGTLIDGLLIPVSEILIMIETINQRMAQGDPDLNLTLAQIDAEIQKGRDFMTAYEDEISSFVRHADDLILSKVSEDADHAFLDLDIPTSPGTSIRDFIYGELDIWSNP